MIPRDQSKPQINPRKLVLEKKERELYEIICSSGYVPEDRNFSDFCESLKSGRAWLISGTRGSGKTAFPEAVAQSCNLPICIVAGRDGLRQEEILYDWDREEQKTWMEENITLSKNLPENEREDFLKRIRLEKWKREFLILGEMGLAFDLAARSAKNPATFAPPVLLLDESDKFGAGLEDSMLMPLERGLIYVPRLLSGYIGVADWKYRPVVVTTSNDLRNKLSSPFISRHLFSSFATPTLKKELEILKSRCPGATSAQLSLVTKLLDAVRGVAGLEDHPSLRESIDVLNAMQRDNCQILNEKNLLRYFCYFVKTSDSQDLLKLQLEYLLLCANSFYEEIDSWLIERDSRWADNWNFKFSNNLSAENYAC